MTEPIPPLSNKKDGLRSRLASWLGLRPTSIELVDVIVGLRSDVAALRKTMAEEQSRLAGLQEQLDRLEKQQARTGKEQYKANLHSETLQQSTKEILEQLMESQTFRERELAALRERLVNARDEGRLEVVQQLFPVLDGLEGAIASGQRWVEQAKKDSPPAPQQSARPPFLQRLFSPRDTTDSVVFLRPAHRSEQIKAQETWLEGVKLIYARLLDILSTQGITPMETEGEQFDPYWHVAVETIPAGNSQPPGSIVQTQRIGYLRGDAVIRYAEVVVAR